MPDSRTLIDSAGFPCCARNELRSCAKAGVASRAVNRAPNRVSARKSMVASLVRARLYRAGDGLSRPRRSLDIARGHPIYRRAGVQRMSEPLVVTIPHRLGKEEARRRIQDGLGRAKTEVAKLITLEQESWR